MILRCYQCEHKWKKKKREGLPFECPECGRDWRKPSLFQRFCAAVDAFKMKQKPYTPRVKVIEDNLVVRNGFIVTKDVAVDEDKLYTYSSIRSYNSPEAYQKHIRDYGISGQVPMQNRDSV
jgi:PHP family Zn ribbon phosphoesterase